MMMRLKSRFQQNYNWHFPSRTRMMTRSNHSMKRCPHGGSFWTSDVRLPWLGNVLTWWWALVINISWRLHSKKTSIFKNFSTHLSPWCVEDLDWQVIAVSIGSSLDRGRTDDGEDDFLWVREWALSRWEPPWALPLLKSRRVKNWHRTGGNKWCPLEFSNQLYTQCVR